MWKSTAIANAGLTKQSLYELERGTVGRGAYDRAFESVDAVNAEIVATSQEGVGSMNKRIDTIKSLFTAPQVGTVVS